MNDDPTYIPGSCNRNRKGQPKTQNAPDLECATPELSQGYRILQALIGISRYFLELPDHRQKGMRDYYDVISKPVCFREIQRKFADGEYSKISEFVMDVRCLLLNCYTYFGPNDLHTKKALKVEKVLEQKVALLPVDLRTLCSLEAENAQTVESAEGVQSRLLQSVIGERSRRERERKQRLSEEQHKEEEGKERDLVLWEQERLFTGTDHEKMESMWELAVIGHFVALSSEQLNISSIPMFEVERMVFMPQASKSLSILMTALLSTPLCRLKLHTKPPMPYRIWTKKLEFKVSYWYKMYIKSDKNANFMFEKFGIEHQFWKILGDWNPLEEYEFHELTVYQRVILIKAVCDYILQNHKILRDAIAEKRDEFGKCLGQDRLGAKFIYFPQLLDQCVRIYRQTSEPKSWMDRDLEYTKLLAEKCNGSTTINGKRRGRKAKNRGKIAKEKSHSGIVITRKSLRNTPKPVEVSVSALASTSDQAIGSSNCGTAGYEGKVSSNKSDLEVLGNEHSNPQTGHSPSSINENLSEETRNEPSISTSCGTDTHLENGCSSSQTSVSEDVYTSYNESHRNKCSGECSGSVSSCNLESNHACDVDHDKKVCPVIVENKNNFAVEQSECVNVNNMPSYQTKSIHEDSDTVIKVSKTRRPLYNPNWLEPNPDDFRLVVDTVEGMRQLLMKYRDDDSAVMDRRSKNKLRKGYRPLCEVKLFHQLSSLVSDLECVEIKILTNTRSAREKLYKEWMEFRNRCSDYVDPDEAFWLNEKEPAETSECQTSETQLSQTSDVLEDTELLQTQVTDPGDTAEDTLQICAGGMKLRHRSVTREKYDGLETSEVSTEVDSDESDNWVVSKGRKNRPKKRKRINGPALLNSSKKKRASEECPQQSPLNQEEAFPKMVRDSVSQIEILDGVKKLAAKKCRVRKNLFTRNEASSNELSHQQQQEENCQKLLNSSANKLYDIAVSDAFRTMPSVSQTGRITVRDFNTKALLPLQSHKIAHVIRTVKKVEKGGVIIDAVNLEMEKDKSHNVEVHDGKVQAGKPSSRNFTDVSQIPKQTHGQETLPRLACIADYKKSHKIVNKHVGVKKSFTRENEKQATEVPVLTPHSGQVLQTHVVIKSQPITATNCPSGSSSSTDDKAPSSCVGQGRKNKTLQQSLGNVQSIVQTETDIICISDNSDDEIEWLSSQYNPKLDYMLERKKMALKKVGQSAVNTENDLTPQQTHVSPKSDPYVQRKIHISGITSGTSAATVCKPKCSTIRTQYTLTPKQMHITPKSDPCVQRNIPTCGMGAAGSTGSSVTTLPNQFETLVTNPNNNTTHLTHNSTILHDKVEQGYPVKHNDVEIHTVAENQDSVSEAVLTVQPSGSSHSVLGNCMLQRESVEHVQSHIPGLSTAKTVLSPIPPSITQNNQNIPVRTQDALTPKQMHFVPKSDPCVQRMVPKSEMEAAASIGSSVTSLPKHFQTPVTNPDNNNTYLTRNSTVIHNNVEKVFPVNHKNVGIHNAAENQDSVSEAVLTLQPSGSYHSVSGNTVLQAESVEHVKSHIPGLSTDNTILSPYSLSSTQNDPNIPVHHSVVVHEPITSVQKSSSMSNGPVPNLQINVGSQVVSSHVPANQGSNINPYIVIVGPCPGTSVIQVTASDTTNRPPYSCTQAISSDARLARTKSPGSKSYASTRIPYPQLTQTRIPSPQLDQTGSPSLSSGKVKCSGALFDRARNCHLPVSQTNDNLPVAVRSSHLLSVQTRNPGFSSTPTKHPHTPMTHTQHPHSLLANTCVPGVHLSSDTPEGQTRIPGTPVTKARNPVTTAVQARIPCTPVAHTRSTGTLLGNVRSPGKNFFSQASSSGVSVVQARNSGSSLFRAQTPSARLPHGRGHPSSRPERELTDVVQQRDQTARLVVIPGEDNVSKYGLVFPSGAKVILTPEQVAEIRAANGGLLTSNFGM